MLKSSTPLTRWLVSANQRFKDASSCSASCFRRAMGKGEAL